MGIKTELLDIFQKHNIKLAYLFGSQKELGLDFLRGKNVTPTRNSDLDIGIYPGNMGVNLMELYGELFAELSLIFEPFRIDILFLPEVNALIQYEVIKEDLIYFEDENFAGEYEDYVIKQAADLDFKRTEFEKDFLEAITDGYFEIKSQ